MSLQLPDIPAGSVVGVNYNSLHDSAVAIVAPDGTPVFCISLERLSRYKQDGRPPHEILEHIPWRRISTVALSTGLLTDKHPQTVSRVLPVSLRKPELARRFCHPESYIEFISRIPSSTVEVCHHLAHTAIAFWGSGFAESLCLTYDGGIYSSPWFGGVYRGSREEGISPADRFNCRYHPDITQLYSFVTALLGFTFNRHEGKITGLAAYGKPDKRCRRMLSEWLEANVGRTASAIAWTRDRDTRVPPVAVVDEFKMEPFRREARKFSREDLAATLQQLCEEHVVEILERARLAGWASDRICLSGGLFANVKLNQRISEMGFKEIFVAPAMTDDGTALGAALHCLSKGPAFYPPPLTTVCLGPRFSNDRIRSELDALKVQHEVVADPAGTIASLLAKGEIVAVFQGPMEFGPRALGNRSILASAASSDINRLLNGRLNRTEFMPFAPVSRVETAADCYQNVKGIMKAAAFMTVTANCTDTMRAKCPGVVHLDGTARPQLVSAQGNPLIHAILERYELLTGIPALVNTSFNIHEEPIVCTPEDAVRGFFEAGLDYLFCGEDCLISFAQNKDLAIELLQKRASRPSAAVETLRIVLRWKTEKLTNQVAALEKAKKWNEQQAADWHAEADRREALLSEAQAGMAALEEAKKWNEQQAADWHAEADRREALLSEAQAGMAALEKAKKWNEQQAADWHAEADRREALLSEAQAGMAALEIAKKWNEQQAADWHAEADRREALLRETRTAMAALEQTSLLNGRRSAYWQGQAEHLQVELARRWTSRLVALLRTLRQDRK